MIFGKTKLELKVGVFVFFGLMLLVGFILSIGGIKTWTSGYRLRFDFHFINGVKIGAPVRYAGVDVGEVKALNFIFPKDGGRTTIEVIGWVNKEIKIPLDSTVWVNTLGLLGEKYIEIMPGKDFSSFLVEDATIVGNDPVATHELAVLAQKIASDVDESINKIKNKEGSLGKLLYTDTIYNELEALVIDIRKHPWKLFIKGKEKK